MLFVDRDLVRRYIKEQELVGSCFFYAQISENIIELAGYVRFIFLNKAMG